MIKIICDTEEQMMAFQAFMAETKFDCPFASIDIPKCEPDEDGNCYLCVRNNIEWEVQNE